VVAKGIPPERKLDGLTPEVLPPADASATDPKGLTPEIVDPRLADVEAMARWFDYAFALPGGFRFGLAGIIGLIPGIGDVLDALISIYIVTRAVQLRVPRVAIARMLVNVGIEAAAGTIPIAGDLFDVAFKANRRNYILLRNHLGQRKRQHLSDWLFLLATIVLVILARAAPVAALLWVIRRIGL
jgi:hypothetical protein